MSKRQFFLFSLKDCFKFNSPMNSITDHTIGWQTKSIVKIFNFIESIVQHKVSDFKKLVRIEKLSIHISLHKRGACLELSILPIWCFNATVVTWQMYILSLTPKMENFTYFFIKMVGWYSWHIFFFRCGHSKNCH